MLNIVFASFTTKDMTDEILHRLFQTRPCRPMCVLAHRMWNLVRNTLTHTHVKHNCTCGPQQRKKRNLKQQEPKHNRRLHDCHWTHLIIQDHNKGTNVIYVCTCGCLALPGKHNGNMAGSCLRLIALPASLSCCQGAGTRPLRRPPNVCTAGRPARRALILCLCYCRARPG